MFYNQNGEIVSAIQLEMNNRSFLYGDGLFERLRLFNGKVFNRQNHYNRLSFSLNELQLDISVSGLLQTVPATNKKPDRVDRQRALCRRSA